jgi:hypothetical protein
MAHSGGWRQLLIQLASSSVRIHGVWELGMELRRMATRVLVSRWRQRLDTSGGKHGLQTTSGVHECVNARPSSIASLLTHVLCVKDGAQSGGKTSSRGISTP